MNWTDPSDIPGIVAQLAKAQPSWERLGPEGRGQVLARFAQWLIDNTGRIEAQLIAETGKSKIDGGIEIPSILAIIAYYAPKAAEFLAPESRPRVLDCHEHQEDHRAPAAPQGGGGHLAVELSCGTGLLGCDPSTVGGLFSLTQAV
ncbi:aldehyde dehydrogenase family protein [Mycobacteroides abscessus 1948]|uniref:Aldehyde dehydrogenase family protein n=1 Tax=Mycobacteroides abscessus 1948 TaxID=1299323 RepID=A0A829QJR0_9MYCO|nr:aldehyde dehydrogenase family protein [Mycobacteroides abscessus 1948]